MHPQGSAARAESLGPQSWGTASPEQGRLPLDGGKAAGPLTRRHSAGSGAAVP